MASLKKKAYFVGVSRFAGGSSVTLTWPYLFHLAEAVGWWEGAIVSEFAVLHILNLAFFRGQQPKRNRCTLVLNGSGIMTLT